MKINANTRLIEAKMNVDNEDVIDLLNQLFGTSFDPYKYNYDGAPFDRSKLQKQIASKSMPSACYKKLLKLLSKTNALLDDGYYFDDRYSIRFGINKWSYIITFKNTSGGTLIILEIYYHGMSLKRWASGGFDDDDE